MKMVNCEIRIFLFLKSPVQFPSLAEGRDFFLGDDFKLVAKALRCCCMPAQMLCKPGVEIDR